MRDSTAPLFLACTSLGLGMVLIAGCPGTELPLDPTDDSGSTTNTTVTTTPTTSPTTIDPCGTGCGEGTTESSTGPVLDGTSSTGSPDTTSSSTTGPDDTSSSGSSGGSESSSGTTSGVIPGTSSSSDDGVVFIVGLDVGPGIECDIWAQDCPVGEKCNAWDNTGGTSWNATACFPIDPAPVPVGGACEVVGSGTSGIDDCELGAMCWDIDEVTNEGTCVALCTGSPAAPSCAPPGTNCVIANDGVLILCLPGCDPLLQDCSPGEACYPIMNIFSCAPDASGPNGVDGDPCEFINVCDPGLACIAPAALEGCLAVGGCCTPFCDASMPGDPCPALSEECVPFFEMGMAPVGMEDVGICAIP